MAAGLAFPVPAPVASSPLACASSPGHPAHRICCAIPSSSSPRIVISSPLRATTGLSGNRRGTGRGASVVCAVQGQDATIQVPDVTKSTWQSLVIESELPVLVEFWASWCGPCKMIDPVVGKLSKDYEGKLKCYKLNTDENPDTASQYGVRSIPTLMIFKNGEKKDSVIGAVPESTLVTCIEKFVESRAESPTHYIPTLTEPLTEIRLLFSSSACSPPPRSRVRRPKHRRGLAPQPTNLLPLAAPPSPSPGLVRTKRVVSNFCDLAAAAVVIILAGSAWSADPFELGLISSSFAVLS